MPHPLATRLDRDLGLGIYHWMFLAQPADLPEAMIGRDPDDYLERTLAAWTGRTGSITAEALAEYRRSFRRPEAIHAACEDYRAGESQHRWKLLFHGNSRYAAETREDIYPVSDALV